MSLRPDGKVKGEVDLRELLARTLFQHQHRLLRWETGKPLAHKKYLRDADIALARAGVENVKIETTVAPRQGR